MKTQFSLLAACLCGIGLVNAQTTTTTNSTTMSTPTNSTYSSQMTTDSTGSLNSPAPTSPMTNSNSTMDNNATNSNSSTTNGNYSTNSMATPADGTTTTVSTETYSTTERPARTKAKDYKNFVFGIYAGLNSTKLKGESTGGDISGRVGYQAGFFVRGGGRLFGQLGAEYFASSSNYFTKGDGQSASQIQDQINIQYVQIPVYIGYKLLQSDRGISAIRLQVGLEYANRINSNSGNFNLTNAEIKSGTFNGLGQLGFDIGPLLIDLTYHYGLSDSIKNPTNGTTTSTGFAGSQRRILSASVGFKF
ncbi:outer membrane beta-barrel protein [Spirosoma sp. HMF4905]|uniref:Outer membrane beta-barrel protein n=1 Tax=Spirosoma arboris TaxID=2682092 RepID=A0A7K1SCM9_9BACT|nr:outer membrane beta-barrel protein [Spirosoma arboris]MVM31296.1 outer membrane beta-barrel protein [Spirosoma arboris]